MTGRTLALAAAAALLLAGGARAQSPSPAADPDRPSTPGKAPPTRTAPVMGGTVRNGNGATSDDAASMGQSSDAAARAAADARREACAQHPPAPDDAKAWRKCEAVGVAPPR